MAGVVGSTAPDHTRNGSYFIIFFFLMGFAIKGFGIKFNFARGYGGSEYFDLVLVRELASSLENRQNFYVIFLSTI